MAQDEPTAQSSLYTIGHSSHSLKAFIALLTAYNIQVVIDIRSAPYSRYSPHFNRDSLKSALHEAGLKYGFYGRHLGGRPDDEAFYDDTGRVVYSKVAQSFLFNEGIERLVGGIGQHRTALLCSEENPSLCHRRLLVSRVLFEQGIDVYHIRGNGCVESEADLRCLEAAERSRQRGLFDSEAAEENKAVEWKSIQSVLHKARRNTSSDD